MVTNVLEIVGGNELEHKILEGFRKIIAFLPLTLWRIDHK